MFCRFSNICFDITHIFNNKSQIFIDVFQAISSKYICEFAFSFNFNNIRQKNNIYLFCNFWYIIYNKGVVQLGLSFVCLHHKGKIIVEFILLSQLTLFALQSD